MVVIVEILLIAIKLLQTFSNNTVNTCGACQKSVKNMLIITIIELEKLTAVKRFMIVISMKLVQFNQKKKHKFCNFRTLRYILTAITVKFDMKYYSTI